MSCEKYWLKITEIAADLRKYDSDDIQRTSLDEIIPLLDAIEVIAHDQTVDFDSAKHILDNRRMNDDLKVIQRFYVKVSTKLEMDKANIIVEAEEPWAKLESFYFYERYVVLVCNERHMANLAAGE